MKKTTRSNFITYGILIGTYIIVEIMLKMGLLSYQIKGLLVPVCVYAILAVSLNLTVGILGELSLGHAGFMCVGAFSGVIFTKCMNGIIPDALSFIIALVIGAAAAGICGIIIGIPVLRLRGDYLAIVTLAFGEIIKNILMIVYLGVDGSGKLILGKNHEFGEGGKWIIEGAKGIVDINQMSTFTVGCILLLITLVIVLNFIHSRTGRAVMAIRDDRIAAEATGININKYKLMAFTVSAVLAGMAGVLYAHNFSTIESTKMDYNMSILILVFVVLGGIGSIRGSMIAAVVLYLLPEMLRELNKYRMLVYAIVLIMAMIFNWSPSVVEWRKKAVRVIFRRKGNAEHGNA